MNENAFEALKKTAVDLAGNDSAYVMRSVFGALVKYAKADGQMAEDANNFLVGVFNNEKFDQNLWMDAVISMEEAGFEITSDIIDVLAAEIQASATYLKDHISLLCKIAKSRCGSASIAEEKLVAMLRDESLHNFLRDRIAGSLDYLISYGFDFSPGSLQTLISMTRHPRHYMHFQESAIDLLMAVGIAGRDGCFEAIKAIDSIILNGNLSLEIQMRAAFARGCIAERKRSDLSSEIVVKIENMLQYSTFIVLTLRNILIGGGHISVATARKIERILNNPSTGKSDREHAAEALGYIAKNGGNVSFEAKETLLAMANNSALFLWYRKTAIEALGKMADAGHEMPSNTKEVLKNVADDPSYGGLGFRKYLSPAVLARIEKAIQ